MKPCNHTPPKPGCRLCWLFEHDARYRQMWGGDPATVMPEVMATSATPPPNLFTPEQLAQLEKIKSVIKKPCIYLGIALEDQPSCGCGGKPALLHECSKFGKCRPYAPRDTTTQKCVGCTEYAPRETI